MRGTHHNHEHLGGHGLGHGHGHGRQGLFGPPGRGGRGGHGPGRHRRGGRRARVSRGEVRSAVLRLLAEEPMHGYQIMQELEDRSGGGWQPSPGSIYPTLAQLADEGLIVSEKVGGKNVFSLTSEGALVGEGLDGPPAWERFEADGSPNHASLRRAMFQLGAAAKQVAVAGGDAQLARAETIINDARKAIYRLLAEDDVEETNDSPSEPGAPPKGKSI